MRRLLKNGLVLVFRDSPRFEPLDVVIEGEVIVALAARGGQSATGCEYELDCQGKYLIPGLIDAHNHLSLEPGDEYALMQQPEAAIALRAAKNARQDLCSGVTSMRTLGEKNYIDLSYRQAFAEGALPGPTITVSGPGLIATGGPGWFIHQECDGVEEIRKAVRARAKAGVDTIKVFVTGSSVHGDTIPTRAYYSDEELKVLVGEAHEAGKPISAHTCGGRGAGQAVRSGIDVIEHGFLFEDEVLEQMAHADVPLVLTPGMMELDPYGGPLWLRDRLLAIRTRYPVVIRKAQELGIRMAVGADCNHTPYYFAKLLAGLVDIGLNAADVLNMATKQAAEICGFGQAGSLQEGAAADILVLEQNPLDDITALQKISLIFKAGAPIVPGTRAI